MTIPEEEIMSAKNIFNYSRWKDNLLRPIKKGIRHPFFFLNLLEI